MRRLAISFSGGETSAYMTRWALENWKNRYDEIVVVFMNTGQEHEETLRFVYRCDQYFGFGTTWIEAIVHHNQRKSATHRVVNFETANRDGLIFKQAIQKYGIPNTSWPHCTRVLKQEPFRSYLNSIGWKTGTYDTAVGIRADEADRISARAKKDRIVYPLITHHPMTKRDITRWWSQQDFRLPLESWKGNCLWCWKKSLRKHLTNLQENPSWYDFPEAMERQYGTVGAEFKKNPDSEPRVFFRGRRSTQDLRAEAAAAEHSPPADSNEFDPILDVGGACGEESCEVFTDESVLADDIEDIFG